MLLFLVQNNSPGDPRPLKQVPQINFSSPLFKTRVADSNHNHQTRHNQRGAQRGHENDTAATGGEFAANDIVLALKVSVEAKEEDQNRDAEKGRTEGFADLAEAVVVEVCDALVVKVLVQM